VHILLGAVIAGQLALHLVIGKESFLYAMHIAPLLIAVAACGTLGRQRVVVLVMAASLVMTAGVNNWRQFERAVESVNAIAEDASAKGAVFQPADECE
jgi:hypothetical protein